MALSPLQSASDRAAISTSEASAKPSVTYQLDFTTGTVGGIIDGRSALEQFIRKSVMTARFRFLIYDDTYGCELDDLIGQDLSPELFETEIEYVITDALTHDERIRDVSDFVIRRDGDIVYVSFNVSSIYGLISTEVTI